MRLPAPFNLAHLAGYVATMFALLSCSEDTPTRPSTTLAPSPNGLSPAVTSNSWSPIAAMPCCDGDWVSVGALPNSSIAYVFGGTNGLGHTGSPVRAYNGATNTWSIKPTEDIAAFKLNGVGAIGGKLYFSGGYPEYGEPTRTSETWEYNPATNVLTRKHDTPLHTADGVSGVIGDKLYVVPGSCYAIGLVLAGFCNQEEAIRKLWRYNPATDIWVTKAPPPHYHRNGAGAVIDNKFFYVVGGTKEEFDSPTRALDVYDPSTNTWKTLAPLPVALIGLSGTALRGLFYVMGGIPGQPGSRRMYAYNPANNTWITKTPPPSGIATVGNGAVKVFLNGTARMLVVQGPDADEGPSTSGIYTP